MMPNDPRAGESDHLGSRAVEMTKMLLDKLSIEAAVTCRTRMDERPAHVWVDIATSQSGLLIGERGTHLHAFEHVLRLLLRQELSTVECRCFVDVNGYRLRRMEFLKRLARDAARRVMSSQHAVTLDPMPAVERRIVHLALTGEALVETGSVGAGADRRVVIRPRDPFLTPEHAAPASRSASSPSAS